MPLEKDPLGRKAVIYWNTAGTLLLGPAPSDVVTWFTDAGLAVASDCFDVTQGTTPEYADITTRKNASAGYSARKPVIREGEVTFDIIWNTNDATDTWVQALIDNSNTDAPMTMAFMDYAIDDPDGTTGEIVQGLIGNLYIDYQKTEAIRDVQRASVTAVNQSDMQWTKQTIP